MDLIDDLMSRNDPDNPFVTYADGRHCWVVCLGDRAAARGKHNGRRHWMYVVAGTKTGAIKTARYFNSHKTMRIPLMARIATAQDVGAKRVGVD